MTTLPKAKKFRIRRSGSLATGAAREAGADAAPMPRREAVANDMTPKAMSGDISDSKEVAGEQDVAEIRKEGLTGRQLRMARRVAQKHGLAPTSDFDAIRLLRAEGIDPFQRSTMLELVTPDNLPGERPVQLPQTVPAKQTLPSADLYSEDTRAREIVKIQRDIAKRRRRKLALLVTRLSFFVVLPSLIAAYYFYVLATPMYASKSEFVIQQAQAQSSAGGLSSMFSGTQFATQQDSIAVQGYLQSRDAMLRLNEDKGFKQHFEDQSIDPIQRLDPGATNEAAYRLYKRHVKIGYDPTEGIIKMEVIAADPVLSKAFSESLISYAEQQVDQLTQRLREDQMQGARGSFDTAERQMLEAQQDVLKLQEARGILSAEAEVSSLMGQISTFEVELKTRQLALLELKANPRPNATKVGVAEREIERFKDLIKSMRSELTQGDDKTSSLAKVTGELVVAEANMQTKQLLLSQALQQLETARIEANRQVRYLSMGVNPTAPDEAAYPRAFENTLLAFVIFGGIYLMFSLTASILREQVSS
ncbi:capsule biosynthesis protein [Pseudogemmobacter sp. W21_MBD1_M6]|uniref:capsule biosynthesis protein n=1 Tax=Pseudogemmobacter sp. W21_MBD1_M6 TaxID=3240271 RepID=UPI003F9C2F14